MLPLKARAKRVIWLFMSGGPSQMDTFDPKPTLERFAGQLYGGEEKRIGTPGRPVGRLTPSPFRFDRKGESGLPVSEIFPFLAPAMDDLCVIRSMTTDSAAHGSACLQANLGTGRIGSPSLGSWASYGLGSERDRFPAFVVMHDPRGGPNSGSANWSAGSLASNHQGTVIRCEGDLLLDLASPPGVSLSGQRRLVDLVARLNQKHAAERGFDAALLGRVKAYEAAFRLQQEGVQLADWSSESKETLDLYGIGKKPTDPFGKRCLMARRLLERGVRFIQIYSGAAGTGDSWDGHFDCAENHRQRALETDQPIAGLMADLKRTGLWDETLLVWMGEFGRTPTADGVGKLGRDHNPHGFVAWLAGAGIKGGQTIGATDELGLKAVESPRHVTDLLATILMHLGMSPTELGRIGGGGKPSLFGSDIQPISEIWS
ncbi:DUF1501 domain-containing protein [bacterium]|nr:DUF1501 domain-containing protein [bacterium]